MGSIYNKMSMIVDPPSNTSKKYNDFTNEPIGNKLVTSIPGVGNETANKLEKLKFVYAKHLVGLFLSPEIDSDESKMKFWFIDNAKMTARRSEEAANCLKNWVGSYV